MKLLLDTECWLWMLARPDRLDADVRALLTDPGHGVYVSAASAWEIARAHEAGRIVLPEPPAEFVPERMRRSRVRALPIQASHALRAAELATPVDFVDRILVAQAQYEAATLVTSDPVFEGADVRIRHATEAPHRTPG